MDFTFSDDALLFQQSVRDFLLAEVTPQTIRQGWETATGRSPELWRQLAGLGLTGITVPEHFGGLGMTALDFVLLAEEAGYVALPEPLVHSVLLAVPTLLGSGSEALQARWLPAIASGEAIVAVGIEQNLLVEDAHIADLLILERGGCVYALEREQYVLRANESVDPSRKLFAVEFDPANGQLLAANAAAQALVASALNHGALGVAAQCLGLARRMLDLTVKYSGERQQFGAAIGSFQAVKHHMANIAYKLEYARAPVYRAAYSLTHGCANVDAHISQAKLMACEVAELAAKNCMQVHGAMGYTWEVDLHIFMKRAWAFNHCWGDTGFHKQRLAESVLAAGAQLGAGSTFALGQ
jgi:alkylation response protein AidB-like acyl-CoA dehydrogenase